MTFGLEKLFISGKVSDFFSHHDFLRIRVNQNGKICSQKYPPISGKLSITNFLNQNATDIKAI